MQWRIHRAQSVPLRQVPAPLPPPWLLLRPLLLEAYTPARSPPPDAIHASASV